jgi:glucosamine 6-phosphate synthetase-like amidotransferase/phosphosugar isomerase protein
VVEQKLLGTYRLAFVELANPSSIYLVKNSGDFALGVSKASDEVVVSSDLKLFEEERYKNKFSVMQIPNNQIVEVRDDCSYSMHKLEKKIEIRRNPKATFNHIMQEEIYESIDGVDLATDFGGKFISNHQVVLGGFEKAFEELVQIKDLLISAKGASIIAAQYGAYIMKELGVFETIRLINPDMFSLKDLKDIRNGGFLTLSQSGADKELISALRLAYT